jgi:hypothetical protein
MLHEGALCRLVEHDAEQLGNAVLLRIQSIVAANNHPENGHAAEVCYGQQLTPFFYPNEIGQ